MCRNRTWRDAPEEYLSVAFHVCMWCVLYSVSFWISENRPRRNRQRKKEERRRLRPRHREGKRWRVHSSAESALRPRERAWAEDLDEELALQLRVQRPETADSAESVQAVSGKGRVYKSYFVLRGGNEKKPLEERWGCLWLAEFPNNIDRFMADIDWHRNS